MNKVVRFFTDPRTIASFAIYLALIAYGLMSAEFGPALSHISNQTERYHTHKHFFFFYTSFFNDAHSIVNLEK